ncbi:hypothetical protein OH492_10175 [Vibrio chagasii]|nr:hypothetical protein [Vibrio chagasii]
MVPSSGNAYVDISELLNQDDLETLDDFVSKRATSIYSRCKRHFS